MRARWATKTRNARGYGADHRTVRAQFTRLVESGKATCAKCGEPIAPGSSWDAGHTPDRTGWTGPEHSRCNRRAGGKNGAAVTNARRRSEDEGGRPNYVRHWSRVWSWPIEPGTYVDPEAVRKFVEEEADRGVHIDPGEVRAYMVRAASLRAEVLGR